MACFWHHITDCLRRSMTGRSAWGWDFCYGGTMH